jgi:hypothetical protein
MNENDETQDKISQLRADFEECRRMIEEGSAKQRRAWTSLAGVLAEDMLRDRQTTERCLQHEDPHVRLVALSILSSHWRPNSQDPILGTYEVIAFSDPDPQVRSIVMTCLGDCARHSNDTRIGGLLATVVCDEGQQIDVRISAYQALFSLRGVLWEWPGLMADPPEDFSFPDDVDWLFVHTFLPQ